MKLERVDQKIFAVNASPSDLGVIGSLHEGNPTEAADIEQAMSLPSFESGLRSIVIGENSPNLEEDNSFYKIVTQQLAYILQAGIPEWHPETKYYTRQFCRKDIILYYSLIDDNQGNDPSIDEDNWIPAYIFPDTMPDEYFPRAKLKNSLIIPETNGTIANIVRPTTTNPPWNETKIIASLTGYTTQALTRLVVTVHDMEINQNVQAGGLASTVLKVLHNANELIAYRIPAPGEIVGTAYTARSRGTYQFAVILPKLVPLDLVQINMYCQGEFTNSFFSLANASYRLEWV